MAGAGAVGATAAGVIAAATDTAEVMDTAAAMRADIAAALELHAAMRAADTGAELPVAAT
jgi:hypothetical protein